MEYTQKQIDSFIEDVFSGRITIDRLPEDLYLAIADNLKDGLYKGFGGVISDFSGKDYELLNELRENIYMFSGAKTYQQVREMTDLLQGPDGLKTMDEFKEAALKIYGTYNENWLETEYKTAVGQGASAVAWQQIEDAKDVLPYLRYNAIIDERTDEICASLHGFCAKVDDPIWDQYAPLNHFNCRCVLDQLEEYDTSSPGREEVIDKVDPLMDDIFKNNPGKTGYVFDPDHPYFSVAKADKELAANNFDLPIPAPEPPADNIPSFAVEADKVIESMGVTIDKSVYNLLEKDLKVIAEKKGGSYAYGFKSEVHIDIGERFQKSEEFQKKVIYHEIGHVIHDQKRLINSGIGVSDEYKEHFKTLRSFLPKKVGLDVETKVNEIYSTTFLKDEEKIAALCEKYGVKTKFDLRELVCSTNDSLMALTNSKYGSGHTKAYMKRIGAKEAEMFAHSMENRFAGNLLFKDVMPEVYEESIKFIKSLE